MSNNINITLSSNNDTITFDDDYWYHNTKFLISAFYKYLQIFYKINILEFEEGTIYYYNILQINKLIKELECLDNSNSNDDFYNIFKNFENTLSVFNLQGIILIFEINFYKDYLSFEKAKLLLDIFKISHSFYESDKTTLDNFALLIDFFDTSVKNGKNISINRHQNI